MKKIQSFLKVLRAEGLTALLTGGLACGISLLFSPGALVAAVAFGLFAATFAAAIDTLYFHLLFALREAPAYAAEKRYLRVIADAQRRLADGSIRLREALIKRFEADYRRSHAATRAEGRSRRQLREAKRQLRERTWAVRHAIPGAQLAAATAAAKSDPTLLEHWMELVDGLVDARIQVQREQGWLQRWLGVFQPVRLGQETWAEWQRFSKADK